ncbi:MAG TPA: ABC transporter permease, partial [Methylomirabilota bacterium]|nr:ABC transporter permease [Methylomirabilota bacterium]
SSEAPFDELILPGLVLASVSLAYVTRLTRTSIAETRRSDYVRTAIAKGLPRRRVVVRHLLRNSLIPVVTFIGADIGALLGGAIVTESVFNLPGVARFLVEAILWRDYPMVQNLVMFIAIVVILSNLAVDMLYGFLDPRVRYG